MKLIPLILLVVASSLAAPPKDISFRTSDGGKIQGSLYGEGKHGIVFVPPPLTGREFWSSLAYEFSNRGYIALTFDPRGRHKSKSGRKDGAFELDVTGAVSFLRKKTAKKVTLIGVANGASIVMDAAKEAGSRVQQIVLLSPGPCDDVEKVRAKMLIIGALRERSAKYAERIYRKRKEQDQYEVFIRSGGGKALLKGERQREQVLGFIFNFLEKGPRKGMRRH